MKSKQKGKVGELEFVKLINNKLGTKLRRTPLSGGMDFKGDVIDINPDSLAFRFNWEIKRQQHLNIYKAMEQSILDSCARFGMNKIPIVAFRRNDDYWKVCMKAEDFFNILLELEEK